MYTRSFVAGWADMDLNGHMRNTAYLDRSADVRMLFFADHGFPAAEFARYRIGPVVQKDEVVYRREIALLQGFEVGLAVAALSGDGSRFVIRNEFRDTGGRFCAAVTSTGGWLDLRTRKLAVPPAALLRAMETLGRTEDFAVLPSAGER